MMMSDEYTHTTDEEFWSSDGFSTREEAIKDAKECYVGYDKFFTGVKYDPLRYHDFQFGDLITEDLYCVIADHVNEDCISGWLDSKELVKQLNEKIAPIVKELVKKLDPPNFWGIEKIVEHKTPTPNQTREADRE